MIFVKIFRRCNFLGSALSLRINTAWHPRFFHSNILYNMKTVYIQHLDGEEKVHVTVNFQEFNMCKVINFKRDVVEKLVDFSKKLEHKLNTAWDRKKRKTVVPTEDIPVLKTMVFLNNEEVPDSLAFQDLFVNDFNGDLKLRISDSDYDVVLNPPLITNMELSRNLAVGTVIVPGNLKSQCTDMKQSDFKWYKSKFPNKQKLWEICGEGPSYRIKEEDLGYHLKLECVPKSDGKVGPVFTVVSETAIDNTTNFDEILRRHELTKGKAGENEFRIVSYNILANLYVQTKEAKSQIFTFCDPAYLEYDYRKNLLNLELHGYNADILCLQEAERKFYNNNLLLFTEWNYDGLYHEKEGTREGSVLLYNREKFNLSMANQYTLTKELLYNPIFSDIKSNIETNEKLIERLNNISSQIQVAVLECTNNNAIVVGNVHFYFHPDADHIRLLQGVASLRILLHEVEQLKKQEPNKKVSVLLCGDFNSTPECGIHQLLSEGSVDSNHFGWKGKEDEMIENVSMSHSLKMKSCYDHDIYTNYTPSFKACIDYIYYQSDHLEMVRNIPVPSEEILSKFKGIPSCSFPSDHVALVADLKFKDSCKGGHIV